jgi:hypothetical protein
MIVGTLTTAWIGPEHHLDLGAAVRWTGPKLEVEARTGARSWTGLLEGAGDSRGGVYGELSIVVPVLDQLALTTSGGRYPSDPVRKVLAAKYLAAGLRLGSGRRRTPASGMIGPVSRTNTPRHEEGRAGRLEIAATGSPRAVRVRVPAARSVEVMADFTDWEPITLTLVAPGLWEAQLSILPGVHRVNIRVDGGAWVAPSGTRLERSEFGEVGIVVVR